MTKRAPIIIKNYDPSWIQLYENEKVRILSTIDDFIESIEHIGSTAIPGIGAKPIIDIMIGVNTLADAERCIAPMVSRLSYEYIKRHEEVFPERRYFALGSRSKGRSHHVHMVETNSDFWREHLLFRDYLRKHPGEAQKYSMLKKRLAKLYRDDRDEYTNGKTSFIEKLVQKAMEEEKKSKDL